MCDYCGRDEEEEKDRSRFLIGAGWLTGIFCAGVIFGLTAFFIDGSEKAGQFGDSFGWVNAALSTVTAAGAIYAVIMQGRELKLARDETRLARREAAASAVAQQELVELQARVAARNAAQTRLDSLIDYYSRRQNGQDRFADEFLFSDGELILSTLPEIIIGLRNKVEEHDDRIEELIEGVSQPDPEALF